MIGPTPGSATMIKRAPHADDRFAGRACRAISGLAFGIGHRGFTEWFAWHLSTPNRYVTKSQSLWNGLRHGS
jgi:hypothetical protein